MTRQNPELWNVGVRKHSRDMIVLISLFFMIAFFYQMWYRQAYETILESANEYHLASTFHYLSATKELDRIQNYQINDNSSKERDKITTGPYVSGPAERSISGSIHLVTMQVKTGITLEKKFDDGNFHSLVSRLEKQISRLSTKLHTQHPEKNISATNIGELLITLNQLSRLHSISHDEKMLEADSLKYTHSIISNLLLLVLILVGIIISKRGFGSIDRLVAEQEKYEEKIRYQAQYDSLTGIPNRLLSLEQFSRLIDDADRLKQKVAVLFIDIDHFKRINDTLGHDTGDKILIEAGRRFTESVRRNDIVGRLGGDEFVIILGRIDDVNNTRQTATKLIRTMNDPFFIDNRKMVLTASIGISIYPEDGVSATDILRNADTAMYHSKSCGRNTFSYFDSKMNAENLRNLEVEEQMRDALSRNEFSLLYQPKIDVLSGEIVGAEALLRWSNELTGRISPDEFIPIAEQTGLIVPIGRFVLEEAIAVTSRLNKHLLGEQKFTMAVNLSPRQFRDADLISYIEKTLNASDIQCHQLELEITEGIFINDDPKIGLMLSELSRLGISIAMDDFGTGYSSISYLRKYPFNVLKIDRSFVSDIESKSKDRELVIAAINMAHNLELKVVAEGVETDDQYTFLKQLKCDYAQGYLFSKPISESEFISMLEDQSAPIKTAVPADLKNGVVHH